MGSWSVTVIDDYLVIEVLKKSPIAIASGDTFDEDKLVRMLKV
jgi:hypothetical protein